jgi:hypothetical protein
MERIYTLIKGYEKLNQRFGRWPSFHDSEIVTIHLNRDAGQPLTSPVIRITIHIFQIEVSPDDPNRNDSLATIVFRDVDNIKLSGFNHQNPIGDFGFFKTHSERLGRDIFNVTFKPCSSFDCSFECGEIEIESVVPFIPPQWKA